MVGKVYTLMLLLVIAAAASFYLTDNVNQTALTVFGFILATLFFGFFIAVLPWMMDKHFIWKQ